MSLLKVIATTQFRDGPIGPLFSVPGLQYTGAVRRKGPINGEQWWLTFESAASESTAVPSPAEYAYHLIAPLFQAEIKTGGPTHTLTIITPDDPTGAVSPIISTTYELLGNAIQLDLREHPKALALGSTLQATAERIQIIDHVINGDKKSDGTTPYSVTDITDGLSGPKQADALNLYYLLAQRRSNGYVQRSQYVFRYTQIASNAATINVGYSNIDRIYTTDQMTAETGPPGGILTAIADAVTNSAPTASDGYAYGWLKQTPTITTSANNKYQISGEYWLGQWSTWIYDPAA